MKVSILGGGNEVGASCVHVEIAGTSLIIDAGMRVHGDDLLPALGMLADFNEPEAILVTHAHADHIGALPIVHTLYPNVPIYATPPTIDLMKIMMKDSYKILEQRSRETNTLPPYTEEQVSTLLNALLFFPASGVLKVGNLNITSFRAGHILGAVMFLIEGEGEKLLITGDISFKAGRTIPGAKVPHQINPDVLIIEATYGNRAHLDRHTEESRLAKDVADVVASGGFALIPAFALGRAQEVLLILQDYMEKGLIPEFPIYVDGLVTPVSHIYNQYPHYLKGPVAYRIKNHGDVFLTEGRCKAVNPKEREEVLKGKPACIVASSGMLIGGASSWYAERLLHDEKNAIFITGYQDEESPGRKLLHIAEGIEDHLELGGISYEVKCRVAKYGLSAHADAQELTRFIQVVNPTYTLLVHGDDEARTKLQGLVDPKHHPILAENGESYPFERRRSGKGIVGKRYTSQRDPSLQEKVGQLLLYEHSEGSVGLAICTGVHERTKTFICQTLRGKQLKLRIDQVIETLGPWNRSMDELKEWAEPVLSFSLPYLKDLDWSLLPNQYVTLNEVIEKLQLENLQERIAAALALQALPREKKANDGEGKALYLIDEESKKRLIHFDLSIQGLKINPTQAMERVRLLLEGHPRYLRCGIDDPGTPQERITIYFDFPHAVHDEERKEIAQLIHSETGWNVDFSPSVRQDLMQHELSKLLGGLTQPPSIHIQERKVVLPMDRPENAAMIEAEWKKITGFELFFKEKMPTNRSLEQEAHLYQAKTPSKRLENNQAMEEAKKWADKRGITLYKTSLRHTADVTIMELHFISPEIAIRHEADMEELSYLIGMPVTFAKTPKQNEIIRLTMESLPPHWQVKKNPSIFTDKAVVSVKLDSVPEVEEVTRIREKIKALTGYELEVSFK
ncbi:MBL fold metallo-hydrolase [Thermicanus aegyptius]|uniref:MBL fold metallo-hydrolase n=1 Tax=Thermicanus aegyptius TaxID=94009 RepID=UPI00040DEC56|nr:MBL fold metallo-hydrolase [Thermicanus aegyptius]